MPADTFASFLSYAPRVRTNVSRGGGWSPITITFATPAPAASRSCFAFRTSGSSLTYSGSLSLKNLTSSSMFASMRSFGPLRSADSISGGSVLA